MARAVARMRGGQRSRRQTSRVAGHAPQGAPVRPAVAGRRYLRRWLYVFRRRLGNLRRLTRSRPCRLRRLHAEQNTLQAGKCLVRLQLALQATLLITQARRPVPIGDDQQQAALAPRGYPAVRTRSGLQLASTICCSRSSRCASPKSARSGLASRRRTSGGRAVRGRNAITVASRGCRALDGSKRDGASQAGGGLPLRNRAAFHEYVSE